ncbi:MAG: TonB-dependent receptor [Acidobacteria bacterium]|nr:TonB-dependent receptor [Acidobacteriota bacterium]
MQWTCLAVLLVSLGWAQTSAPETGIIRGQVRSGNTPIPGATVSATNTLTGQKAVIASDLDGSFVLVAPANGRYVVKVQMLGFAPATAEVVINAASLEVKVDLDLVLLSRAQQSASAQAQAGQRWAQGLGAGNRNGGGFQSLSVTQGEGVTSLTGNDENAASQLAGMSSSATESVAVSGNTTNPFGNMSSEELRERFEEARQQAGFGGGGFGGPGGPGGFGGPGGGGPPMMIGMGRGRFNFNRPHGMVYYSVGDSALNAAPYALRGTSQKPGYVQQRFGASLGGPLNIPKIYKGGDKTFFFVNYNGSRSENPFDAFATVPTLAERSGDFSNSLYARTDSGGNRLPVQLYDPSSGLPVAGNNLQTAGLTLSPIAQGLLQYIPLPNIAGASPDTQNFHYVTSATSNSDDLNVRLNRSLGGTTAAPGPRRLRGPQNNLSFGFHYHGAESNLTNVFSSVGGKTTVRSFDIPVAYIRSFGKLTNVARFDFNRNRAHTQNLYAFSQNIAGNLGIGGVSQDPFDWGLPNLSFSNFGSLSDTNPSLVRNQTYTFSDSLVWTHGKHTLRWGGDFRRIQLNTESSTNARGTFVFTGLNTSSNGASDTGFDLADFLLGLPQQTSLQCNLAGAPASDCVAGNYHFRGNSWDLFAQDEWRLRGNLTLNLGLRYEYVSPFSELDNRIATLDIAPQFFTDPTFSGGSVVAQVLPGASGPYHGGYPDSLVHPDRNNFAPRIGLAWKPWNKTVVRAGYGINYNTTAYQSMIQNLAFQPPFALTQTNVQSAVGGLTLQDGFPAAALGQITNNFAVDPNYRLGYVQMWNLNIQQEIRPTLILNVDYTGTKGTRLDILEDPNRLPSGIRLNGQDGVQDVSAFNWETSGASSHASVGSVRVRKRLQNGFSVGGRYVYAKAIDDASSIGGSGNLVAQDAFNLAAERSLSSFDQRHKFTGDYLLELPFGHDKRWLNQAGLKQAILGDWQWSGSWTIASGSPFTPRVLGNFYDVNRGTNGTLRPDVVPGESISLSSPSRSQWFNTAAFVSPAGDAYGDARRNSIIGPGSVSFDMAINKVFPMRDNRNLEFRLQASNVFNHPNYASIDTTINSPTYGQVVSVSSMRTVQLTARFRF